MSVSKHTKEENERYARISKTLNTHPTLYHWVIWVYDLYSGRQRLHVYGSANAQADDIRSMIGNILMDWPEDQYSIKYTIMGPRAEIIEEFPAKGMAKSFEVVKKSKTK